MAASTRTSTSELLNRLSESATLAMARITRELKDQGIDVIGLSLGEPDFNTPDFIKEAAKKAIDENYTHYPPVNGYAPLREAISAKFKRDNGLDYSPEQIVVSTGAKQSLANVVLSVVNPGDEVILPAPYWVTYSEIVKMAGGIPVVLTTTIENDFKVTGAELEAAINERTRMIIYSSPCNPSGSVYSAAELEDIANVVSGHENVLVISDEIYELINFTGEHCSLGTFEQVKDQVITVNGVSKGFAMTGWRLGYIGAPLWIAKACSKMQGQFTSAPSGISQMAAKAAVEADPAVVDSMREAFFNRRDYVLKRLTNMPLKANTPEGAFYVFPDVSQLFGSTYEGGTIQNADDVANYLLEKAHVATVTGIAFGDPNCIRISYAASMEHLEVAMDRIESALNQLEPKK